jgi:type I restriction enzyme M protein
MTPAWPISLKVGTSLMPRTAARHHMTAQNSQPVLPLRPNAEEHLDAATLEQWLWDATCEIRGATDAPKFKDSILPLVFFKRLADVFDDEFAAYVTQYGSKEVARAIIEADHADALATGRKPIVRFNIPESHNAKSSRWNGSARCWRS